MDTDFVDFTRFVCDSFLKTNILRSPEVNVSKSGKSMDFVDFARFLYDSFFKTNILQSSGGLNVSKKRHNKKR